MQRFFTKLYKYKQSDNLHKKENYLTEILAYCLENDEIFNRQFLITIGIRAESTNLTCITQLVDKEFGKPDIFITINNNTAIIIECKVDCLQGNSQLYRYSEILNRQSFRNKIIVFLTKYNEEVEELPASITYKSLRWHKIYDLLAESNDAISKQFRNFLIDENMSSEVSFIQSDLSAIKNYSETIAKMKDFLTKVKDMLLKHTKRKFHLQKLADLGNFGLITDFHGGTLWLGFYQYEDDTEMQLSISIEDLPTDFPNYKEIVAKLKVNKWQPEDTDAEGTITWYNHIGLSQFFIKNKFLTNNALMFLESETKKIKNWL